MNVYQRIFKVTTGPLFDRINEIRAINKAAHKEYSRLLKKWGATQAYRVLDEKLVAIQFENTPDPKLFKKVKNGWYPKKSTKAGKELVEQLSKIENMPVCSALSVIGLSTDPTIFLGGYVYFPSLIVIPTDPVVAFIKLPWYDEDPAVIAEYLAERKEGTRGDGNLDALEYQPTADMVEVKEWQLQRAVTEWNDSLKKAA